MNTLEQRINKAFEYRKSIATNGEKITKAAIALACGVSAPSVNDWFSGKTKNLDGNNLLNAAKYLKVNPEWLGSGKGRMDDALAVHENTDGIEIKNLIRSSVPVVGSAKLGDKECYFSELEYPIGNGDGYIQWATSDPNAYALRCRGDSMKPRIRHDEFVVVEPNHEYIPGDEVMVKDKNGRVMIKQFAYRRGELLYFTSVNETYAPFSIPSEEIDKVHYVAGIAKSALYREA